MLSDQIKSSSSAGKLHLLDLAGLKDQMGEKWGRMTDTVERFFDGAVRRNLGPGDTFVRQGELSYLLLFRDLSPEEVQVKCRTISEEVCERLFGDQIQKASFRALIMPLEANTFAGDNVDEALNELLERKGNETIFQTTTSKGTKAAGDAETSPPETDGSAFLYHPIWDATKNVVVTYLCANDDARYSSILGTDRELAAPQDRQAAIDRGILKECSARAQQLHRSGLRVLFGVSVALDTLTYPALAALFA